MNEPDAGGAHRAAGWHFFQVSRYADAAREAQLALGSEPEDADAHRLQALALSMLGRHKEADRAVGAALRADPQDEWSHRIRAHVLLNSGEPAAALASARVAIRLLPTAPEAHSLAAEIQLRLGEPAAALGSARSALALRPDHVASLIRAAHAAERLGKADEALAFARRAVACDPQDGDAHRALGVAAFRAGDRATARAALREALRLDPMNEAARAELLRTLRSRSPVYRVADTVTRWFQGEGAKVTRGLGFGLWIAARALVSATENKGFSLVFLILPIVLVLPLWIIPLHDLIVWRDSFGRWLLEKWEKVGAAFTGIALAIALALVAPLVATGGPLWAWAAAGFAALGAYGSLLRRVRTRAAAWRVGAVAGLLVVELVGALVAVAIHGAPETRPTAALFPMTILLAYLLRRRLIGKPPANAR
jgi:tetratricopeptide (TPR) repeat protein